MRRSRSLADLARMASGARRMRADWKREVLDGRDHAWSEAVQEILAVSAMLARQRMAPHRSAMFKGRSRFVFVQGATFIIRLCCLVCSLLCCVVSSLSSVGSSGESPTKTVRRWGEKKQLNLN